MESKKPSKLDWILTYTPIPILGEISARRTASYISNPLTYSEDFKKDPSNQRVDLSNEEDINKRVLGARITAYILVPLVSGIVYELFN